MRILAFFLLPALCVAGDSSSLTDLARGLPAEFAADSLLRIAALPETPKAARVALLQSAFETAAGAQRPVSFRPAVINAGGAAAFLNRASLQGLDALTLRLRAIDALLPLDPAKARELFQQLPPLDLEPATCAQNRAYDVGLFYRLLASVAAQAPPHFLDRYMAAVTSPAQVGPAAAALGQAALGNADFRTAVTAFAAALQKIAPDDRSFTLSALATSNAIQSLLNAATTRGVPSPLLLDAWRAYLVSRVSGERCADDAQTQGTGPNPDPSLGAADAGSAEAIRIFNEKLRVPPTRAIERYQTYPAKAGESAAPSAACSDAACQAVREGYRRLLFNSVGVAYNSADRAKPEWRDQLPALLDQLAQWKDSDAADPVAAFAAKCGFYTDLAGIVVLPEDSDAIYRSLVDFLKRSPLRESHRMEWFLPVNVLIARRLLLDELANGSDAVIALYAQLERLAPRPPESIMPLL